MVVFPTSCSIEFDIGACLESHFPSFLLPLMPQYYTCAGDVVKCFIAYPYLVQQGHNVLENKCGHLQATIYVVK